MASDLAWPSLGEWWVDVPTHTLYIIPNTTEAGTSTSTGAGAGTSTTLAVIAPRLQTLLAIRGADEDPAGGSDGAAQNITLRGLTFAHSARRWAQTRGVVGTGGPCGPPLPSPHYY